MPWRTILAMTVVFSVSCGDAAPVATGDASNDAGSQVRCTLDCGDGFQCDADASTCVPDNSTSASAEVLAPPAGWGRQPQVTLQCRVSAPQLKSVSMVISSASQDREVRLSKVFGQDYWEAIEPLDDGSYTAACVLTFGPEGHENTERFAAQAFGVDTATPVVTLESSSGWFAFGNTATVVASVTDLGQVVSSVLKANKKEFVGIQEQDKWTFSIPAENLADQGHEGALSFTVTATDAVGNQGHASGELNIDSVAPSVAIASPSEWLPRSASATITATIFDAGLLNPSSVRLVVGEKSYPATLVSGVEWRIDVPLVDVTMPGLEGAVAFKVRAADIAGNETAEAGVLKVDDVAPNVVVEGSPDSTWRASDPFDFIATIGESGAPVKSATLAGPNGAPLLANAGTAANPKFVVNPVDWQASNTEGNVAWTLRVEDEAGNVTLNTGAFKIDRKPPQIDVRAPTQWFNSSTVTVSPVVTDNGSGPALAGMKWSASGSNGNCSFNGATWTCAIATPLASGTSTKSFPFQITANDLIGNTTTAEGFLKIDKKGPTITITPDGKWYNRSDIITVRATVTDDGVGLPTNENAAPFPQLVVTAPTTSTHTGTRVGNQLIFMVPGSSLVDVGGVASAPNIVVNMWDALGNEGQATSTSQFRVDGSAPTVKAVSVTYPSGRNTVVVRDPFESRDRATVRVTIQDLGSGLVPGTIKLIANSVDFLSTGQAGDVYSFSVNASAIELSGAGGSMPFSVVAKDHVGLEGSSTGNIAYDRVLWSRTVHADSAPVGGLAFGNATVYATLNRSGSAGTSGHNIVALARANGATSWASKVPGTPTTPVTVSDDYVFFASSTGVLNVFSTNSTGTSVTPFLTASGLGAAKGALGYSSVKWGSFSLPGNPATAPTIFHAGNDSRLRVFTITNSGSPFYNSSLNEKHSIQVPASVEMSTPAYIDGHLYVGSTSGRVAKIKAIKNPGQVGTWNLTMEYDSISSSISGAGAVGSLGLTSNGLVMFTTGNTARFLTPTLASSYTTTMPANIVTSPNISVSQDWIAGDTARNLKWIVHGATMYVLNSTDSLFSASPVHALGLGGDDQVYAAFADKSFRLFKGTSTWSVPLASVASSEFVLDCSGIAYVGTDNGTFYAIVTDSVGLAKSAWPRFQHDNRNTGDAQYATWNGNTCID